MKLTHRIYIKTYFPIFIFVEGICSVCSRSNLQNGKKKKSARVVIKFESN